MSSFDRAIHGQADNGRGTPHARSTVTSAELLEIPAEMQGRFCWFQATAGTTAGAAVDVAIRFGTSAAMGAVVIDDRSSLAGATLTADVNVPHLLIRAGADPTRIRLSKTWTHMSHISGATTGALRFGLAESGE